MYICIHIYIYSHTHTYTTNVSQMVNIEKTNIICIHKKQLVNMVNMHVHVLLI